MKKHFSTIPEKEALSTNFKKHGRREINLQIVHKKLDIAKRMEHPNFNFVIKQLLSAYLVTNSSH